MSFPVQSSEKLSLVPVIAMLLQFNGKELAEVQRANREESLSVSLWGGKAGPIHSQPVKEIRKGGGVRQSGTSTGNKSSPNTANTVLLSPHPHAQKKLSSRSLDEASISDRDLREKLTNIKTDILSFPSDEMGSPPPSPIEAAMSQSI